MGTEGNALAVMSQEPAEGVPVAEAGSPGPDGLTPVPVTAATQEVRFATAMTGGVSLAIWMGGVARELNLLDQASRRREGTAIVPDDQLAAADLAVRDRYHALLGLLDLVIRIDVLSGTSAGGINAALLGTCHAAGWDLGWLRNVWLKTGDFELLLRDPASKDPPSLLRGDGVLLQELEDNIQRNDAMTAEARPTSVHIATTLLDGETSRFTDSYGTLVPDVSHLGVFHFTESDLRSPDGRRALALAARASASFPAAFEPAFLPFQEPVRATGTDPGPAERPAMAPYLPVTRCHWAADGGILANRPLRPILDSIFEQPAVGREVRRVLLYVVPDPGGTPRPEDSPPAAEIGKPLSLAAALVGDVGSIQNQSIAAELTAIQQDNDRVDAMRDSRLRVAELGATLAAAARAVEDVTTASAAAGGEGGEPRLQPTDANARIDPVTLAPWTDAFPTDGAWADYRARQGEWLVRPLVQALMQHLSTLQVRTLPATWQDRLGMGTEVERACCRAASEELIAGWLRPSPASTPADLATLGRPAFDGVKGILLSLLQLAFATNPEPIARAQLATLGTHVHETFRPDPPEPLQSVVSAAVDQALKAATPQAPMPSLESFAAALTLEWSRRRDVGTNPAAPRRAHVIGVGGLPEAWELLNDVLAELVPALDAVAASVAVTTPAALQAARKLRTYLDYLGPDPVRWRHQLVGLYVMDRSMLPVGATVDQKVELVQVSATTRTLLDPERSTPAAKLTGVQFHHFGAFYKSSWRANDWMWGRLDGAGWLVHVLLDPRRILAVVDADWGRYRPGERAERFFADLQEVVGVTADPAAATTVAALNDLRFLDDGSEPPLSLPNTSLWLATAWQRPIAGVELPVVAREALATPTKKDQKWAVDVLQTAGRPEVAEAASRLAVAKVASGRAARATREQPLALPGLAPAGAPEPPPGTLDELATLLPSCQVAREDLAAERGEPLFTKTLAKATAVATAAATAVKKPPATIETVFRTARTTTLTGYRAADIVGFWPRRMMAIGAGTAALGVLLAAQNSALFGLTGVALVLAGLYLVAFGVWSTSPRIIDALLATTLIAGIFALSIPVTRRSLFGTADGTELGWVSEHLVPWMRERWWALLLVLTVLILLPAAGSYVARWAAPHKQEAPRPT